MRVLKYYVENKGLFETWNKVNENKVLSYCKALKCETIKNKKKLFSFMSNLQSYYHFKLDFQKVDQHTGGKWLIHGTRRRKDNQLQRIEFRCKYPSGGCKHHVYFQPHKVGWSSEPKVTSVKFVTLTWEQFGRMKPASAYPSAPWGHAGLLVFNCWVAKTVNADRVAVSPCSK